MTDHTLAADLRTLKNAVAEAVEIARSYFENGAKVWEKSPNNPVTEADLAVDALLKDRLTGARPEYGWLSEETADDPRRLSCARVWMVDPIDGTRAFVRHVPEFTVCAGLVEDGRPIAGVVANPMTGETFAAVAGGGCERNGVRAHVSDRSGLADAVILGSRHLVESATGPLATTEFRKMNSIAYRMALVAVGSVDATVAMSGESDWDTAAAEVIVSEAGGIVTDLSGALIRYNLEIPRHSGVIVAGPKLHGVLLGSLRRAPVV